ncbi:MAG: hypothetical protein GX456_19740 [Verrucomicrobia bacterium]|nr:hypothetical protein [Verrucomicrobiota bacterium]
MAIDSAKNPSAATYTLSITNVQLADAGGYFVIATDSDSPPGSATSRVAILKVDPTFTKITKGQVVEDQGPWGSGYWGDFDGDGLVDLFVPANILPPNTYYKCALYRNLGGDNFERVTNAATDKVKQTWWSLWADFDNNGTLDLFALHPAAKNELFRNDGRGNFTPVFCTVTSYTGTHWGAEWVDFDRDGFLDILVTAYNGKPRFFHGRGDGYFWVWTSSDVGPWINDVSSTFAPAFCDIDGDGDADLYMSEAFGLNALYRNDGTGQLEPVTAGTLPTGLSTASVLWADINNDGLSDLLTVDYDPGTDLPGALRFYRNLGEWEFQDATVEAGLDSPVAGWAVAVADFDNDGDLDIYAPNYMGTDALYENQGDGTFVQKDVGSPLTEGTRDGAAWADYNNDGFMDLFKGCGDLVTARSLLYRNSLKELAGNNNGWLMVRLVGIASNRSAIGACVRAEALIGGKQVRQLRQIQSGPNPGAGLSGLNAHFGLGDAAKVDVLRIQWPSGIVQELRDVPSNQTLTVTEHQETEGTAQPQLSVSKAAGGPAKLTLTGQTNLLYVFETSTDLVNWAKLGVRKNETGTVEYVDELNSTSERRFYRAVAP